MLYPGRSDSRIRLADGPNLKEGRVELWRNGEWGTVCDDGWSLNDAHVVCKVLGYSGASEAPCCARYGRGTGRIMLDNVGCSGSERSLLSCSNNGAYVHNCGHHEDASAVCELLINTLFILSTQNMYICLYT